MTTPVKTYALHVSTLSYDDTADILLLNVTDLETECTFTVCFDYGHLQTSIVQNDDEPIQAPRIASAILNCVAADFEERYMALDLSASPEDVYALEDRDFNVMSRTVH